MTHLPLLLHMARKGKPLIISTGTADLDEVGQVVGELRAFYGSLPLPVVLLQCTASYPTPPGAAHVQAVVTLREAFGVPSGLSDHTRDPVDAPAAAVALGAVVVEKHYTLSNQLAGPDHKFALEPHELREMVRRIRGVQQALGSGRKVPDGAEAELRHFARRSLFTTRPIARGEAFSGANTRVLRRGKQEAGLAPRWHPLVLGRTAARDLLPWQPLQADDVGDTEGLRDDGVLLRRAVQGDIEWVWQLHNEPGVRAVSLNPEPIPWDDHVAWFARQLDDPTMRLWLVLRDGERCGVLRIDGRAKVSTALAADVRGQGVGRAALRLACRTFAGETGADHVDAEILADNLQSQKAFAAAGFVHRGTRDEGSRAVQVWRWELAASGRHG
jgi:RimJ/RimL family protein N-acetyltransferase